ncbi:MAG: 4-hydroxy-3-methylbut-2-enyl diphosphate reductase [Candidatus Cloacimonetes bacterium]|nr:4-hydroxy-3-methylbut-2-enyl diphosphate reductase [Candidatus Cloacimonadota bacterium]
MIVRLAMHSGFCFGVRRAIDLARDAAYGEENIYTYGALIHNPEYVRELEAENIFVVDDINQLHNSTVIIRSHGIRKQDYELLKKQGNTIIDATCPYVKRTHDIIEKANKEGYPVYIFGDRNHPEVLGIESYGDERTRIFAPGEDPGEIEHAKLCIISQTTQKISQLKELACIVLPHVQELRVFNTICLATSQRQKASIDLAKDSDLMLIVGGKTSANTKMLAQLCSEFCQSIHIERARELSGKEFEGKKRIGIAAGASTPSEHIIEVYNKILKINGDSVYATGISEIPLFKEES